MPELITPPLLKELVAANAVRSADVVGDEGGFVVTVKYGMTERFVAARNNKGEVKVRVFSNLTSVDKFLRETVHIVDYHVNAKNYRPAPRAARYAHASDRLKRVHEEAAYTQWLKAEIQESIDDPRPSIPNDEVKRHFAERRAALRKRIAAEQS